MTPAEAITVQAVLFALGGLEVCAGLVFDMLSAQPSRARWARVLSFTSYVIALACVTAGIGVFCVAVRP